MEEEPTGKNPDDVAGPVTIMTSPELSVACGCIHVTLTEVLFGPAVVMISVGQLNIAGGSLSVDLSVQHKYTSN